MRLKLTKQWWQMGWLVVLSLYSSGMTYAADVPPDYFYADQNNTISVEGTVTGSDGMPVAGATITVKGQNEGTVTDADGRFLIKVAEDAILVISSVGYVSVEVKAASVVNVVLQVDNLLLNQVVVVGYGSQSKKNITGSISSVEGEEFANRPVFSTAQALQGKAAGVQVTQPSGKPGTEFSIRIRGTNSVNANNDPLYVIDGIPTTDTRGLNPNDIESMQILKDAASAAIYGARASNGVVLITTKKGSAGSTATTFNTYFGFTRLAKSIDVLNGSQYIEYMRDRGEAISEENANTDWEKETFGTGINQNYQLAFSGGTEQARYYLSLGYLGDKGMVRPAEFKRYSARLNVDSRINKWLTVGSNINFYRTNTYNAGDNASSGRGGIILSALNSPPNLSVYDTDNPKQFSTNPFQASWETPLSYMSREDINNSNRFLGNAFAEIRLMKDLKFRTNLAADISNGVNEFYVDPVRTVYGRQNHGISNVSKWEYMSLLAENTLTYTNNFGLSNVTALVGLSVQDNNYGFAYINTKDLPLEPVKTTNAGNQVEGAGNTKTTSAIVSQFGRLMYDYDSKYLLTVAVRRDGSSKLAAGNKWDIFPSFSAGWRISQEEFFKNIHGVNDLKLRGGWGQTGNQEGVSDFAAYGLLGFSRITPGNVFIGPGIRRLTIANPELRWEKTTQTNIGFDITVLENRLTMAADVYWKKTHGLIMSIPLPSSVGVEQPFIRNDGELENKGVEFMISSINFKKEKITWNTDFNISFNKNKVSKLGLQKIYDYAKIYSNGQNAIRMTEGQPLGSFYGYISEGVDPESGNIKYRDLDGNGIITPDDRTFIGQASPKFIYGMTNNLSFMGFDLSIFIQGVQGNKIFNATKMDLEGMFDSKNQSIKVLDRWKNPGDITSLPRANEAGDGSLDNIHNSTRFVEDGSFLRLKAVTLAYNIPTGWIKRANIRNLSIYATAQNLLTLTKYSGFDPEVNAYGVNSRGTEFGVDYGTYPQTRQIIFGLNLGL
ncbi:MAG TPA: TonB-dependent receptor [Saprospiraceae bacterium]|jgi:TonB-linked SusC/RagA family outer membrane protein|nr:TonB-dependent receptor [Saprospiraceae bacterium]HRP83826.1 TonB-dependent receptor [Saprospiraceae bacterium]